MFNLKFTLFSLLTAQFCISASSEQGFQFLYILPNTCYFICNDYMLPSGYEGLMLKLKLQYFGHLM